jgi:hypothetical protein
MPYYSITPIFYAANGGETNTAPWTQDLQIAPSSVYGLAALNWVQQSGGGAWGAIVGFLQYYTQNPDTGVPSPPVTTSAAGGAITAGSSGGNVGWLNPVILDENVIIITLAWNCFADNDVHAMGSFTVFLDLD